jgi:hypothetical protein
MNMVSDILIGVASSLVATIIWVAFSSLHSFSSRQNIALLLEQLYDSADSFDSAIETSNTSIAEVQADKIIECCMKIIENIKPLTFLGNKRKLVYSLLYNAYYTVSYYKRIFVGYDGELEQSKKLEKFRKKYYYKVYIYNKDPELSESRCFLMISIVLLQELNRYHSAKKALTNNLYINDDNVNKAKTYHDLICARNLKSGRTRKYDLIGKTFTYEQYKRYVNKKLNKTSHNTLKTIRRRAKNDGQTQDANGK